MPKTDKLIPVDVEKTVMAKVKNKEITMKPRWYFVMGSGLMVAGLAALGVGVVFLTNLMLFLLRQHGPRGEWRLQQMLQSFPWWVPILAVGGLVLGVRLLKQYDFSYKKNFRLIVVGLVAVLVLAAVAIDQLGLNEIWSRQGPMRRIYQQLDGQGYGPRGGHEWRNGLNKAD